VASPTYGPRPIQCSIGLRRARFLGVRNCEIDTGTTGSSVRSEFGKKPTPVRLRSAGVVSGELKIRVSF